MSPNNDAESPRADTLDTFQHGFPVLANSVPKSGTHLLGKALALLGVAAHPTRLDGGLGIRTLTPVETDHTALVGSDWPSLVKFSDLQSLFDKIGRNCFLYGHLPFSQRVENMVRQCGFRMVVLMRDPRDVAVSHVRWTLTRGGHPAEAFLRSKSEAEQLSLSIAGFCLEPAGPLSTSLRARFQHILAWQGLPYVYVTRFERLVGPKGGGSRAEQIGEIRLIAQHIGCSASDQKIEWVADNLFGDSFTFREGQIGGWRKVFTADHTALVKQEVGDMLVAMGYEKDLSW